MKIPSTIPAIVTAFLCISSCSVIEGTFNAGMSAGIILTVFCTGIILYLVPRISRNNNSNQSNGNKLI